MSQIQIFDDHGRVLDLDPVEVSKLDKAEQEILTDVLQACRRAEAQDQLVIDLRKLTYEAVAIETTAIELDQITNIAVTDVEAARMVMAANNPNLPKPKPRKVNAKVRAAREVASLATINARQLFNQATKIQRETTNPARAAQIVRFISTQTPPEGRALAQVREFQQRGNAERAANVADHGTPEPAKPVIQHLCEMERAGPLAKVRQRRPAGPLVAVKPLGHKY
jgi:hypothetical protein